eukprot:COSAG01_NODE_4089_length_5361_cov_2.720258_3_plen_98_part_00
MLSFVSSYMYLMVPRPIMIDAMLSCNPPLLDSALGLQKSWLHVAVRMSGLILRAAVACSPSRYVSNRRLTHCDFCMTPVCLFRPAVPRCASSGHPPE